MTAHNSVYAARLRPRPYGAMMRKIVSLRHIAYTRTLYAILLALKKPGGADGSRTRITWLTTKDFTVKLQPHTPPSSINIQKNPSVRKSFCVSQVGRNLRLLGFYMKHIRMISKCKQKQRTTQAMRFGFSAFAPPEHDRRDGGGALAGAPHPTVFSNPKMVPEIKK